MIRSFQAVFWSDVLANTRTLAPQELAAAEEARIGA